MIVLQQPLLSTCERAVVDYARIPIQEVIVALKE